MTATQAARSSGRVVAMTILRVAAFDGKVQVVIGAGAFFVDDFGLGDGGLEIDVPHDGAFGVVDLVFFEEVEEAELADAAAVLVDGGVFLVPVVGEAEAGPEALEGVFVFPGDDLAELDEVAAADGFGCRPFPPRFDFQIGIVVEMGFAFDVVEVLDTSFGGEAVVVPADREKDVLARHALVTNDEVLVGIAEQVADVERAADRGGRCIDNKGLLAWALGVPGVEI